MPKLDANEIDSCFNQGANIANLERAVKPRELRQGRNLQS